MKKLEVIIAINGGAVLVLEIIGARLMAPFFGTSIYVWTAIIGVILLALSVGYWYGGNLADKVASQKNLSIMFLFIALILSIELAIQPWVLEFLADSSLSLRLSAFLAAMSVYALPATLMGFVSPYITKLSVKSLKHTGETVGRLYAAGTIGSIAGTFLSGYWLTGHFTNESINWAIVIIYVGLAITTYKYVVKDSLFWIVLVCVALLLVFSNSNSLPDDVVYQEDTPYARYKVIDTQLRNKPTRILASDRFVLQSGILLDDPDEPAFVYVQNFLKIAAAYENPQNILIVGGGAYTMPQYLADIFPNVNVDIVEIDGALEKISIDYFNYVPSDNFTNIITDGRTFLNQNNKKYDLIFLDAFSSNQPPYQLSTKESFMAVKNSLSDSGIVALNTIGSQTGERSEFIAALDNTFSGVFATSSTLAYEGYAPDVVQNILLIGSNGAEIERYTSGLKAYEPKLVTSDIVLTDSFAPTERLLFN